MTVLVTGATGFLGSRVARRLSADGVPVRALVRTNSDRRRLDGLDLEWAVGDITDPPSLVPAVRGVHAVVHTAAVYEIGARDPAHMERVNVGGSAAVFEVAAERGVPVVHVSSTAALGPTGTEPQGEEHWAAGTPVSPYERTKRDSHLAARAAVAAGADVRIASPGTIYGPDDPSLVGRLHAWAARRPLVVGGLPDLAMSLVHVDDAAEALACLAVGGEPRSEWVLSAQVVTFRQWFEALARVSRRRPPRVWVSARVLSALAPGLAVLAPLAGMRPGTVREGTAMSERGHWAFSGEKARRQLGWRPRSLDDGLEETAAWYRAAKGGRV